MTRLCCLVRLGAPKIVEPALEQCVLRVSYHFMDLALKSSFNQSLYSLLQVHEIIAKTIITFGQGRRSKYTSCWNMAHGLDGEQLVCPKKMKAPAKSDRQTSVQALSVKGPDLVAPYNSHELNRGKPMNHARRSISRKKKRDILKRSSWRLCSIIRPE